MRPSGLPSRPWLYAVLATVLVVAPAGALAASLTAGDVDDHLNFDHYLAYLDRTRGEAQEGGLPALPLEDRVTLAVHDTEGAPIPLARVEITPHDAASPSIELVAGSDGLVRFFPTFDGFEGVDAVEVTARPADAEEPVARSTVDLAELGDKRRVAIELDAPTTPPERLDLMVVLDTTGSMGDELGFLTTELRGILANVTASNPDVDVNLGLTLYRDQGDDYVVRSHGFSGDIRTVEQWLAAEHASGGGDYEEAVHEGLAQALDATWRGPGTAKLLLLVGDAPPHQQDQGAFLDAVRTARHDGVRISPLAASGVDQTTEYLFRAAEVLTQGRYLFLTDDSGIGDPHKEPAIPCYLVTSLENLLTRVVRSEVTGERVEPRDQQIIREVGDYEQGVCLGDPPEDDPASQEEGSDEAGTDAASEPASTSSSSASRSMARDAATGGHGVEESAETPWPGLLVLASVAAAAAVLPRRRRA